MDGTLGLMLVLALAIAIVMSIGSPEIRYLGTWLKCKQMQSRKTKTEYTHYDSQGS